MAGSKSVSSILDELHKIGLSPVESIEFSESYVLKDKKTKSSFDHHILEPQRMTSISTISRVADHVSESQSDPLALQSSLFSEGNIMDLSGSHFENGLFSSSLSDIFNNKCVFSSFPFLYFGTILNNAAMRCLSSSEAIVVFCLIYVFGVKF